MTKKIIVSTTINPVTPAIDAFQQMTDWELVIVGDLKTPHYELTNGTYLTPDDQRDFDNELSEAIGWNCIQRRNIGMLYAYQQGADIIAVVDDDNIPLDNWGKEIFVNQATEVNFYKTDLPAFDPVGATNGNPVWHRGYPLQLLSKRDYSQQSKQQITPDFQADLWHGDPDTDAICRLIYDPELHIDANYFPLAANKTAPFNSQNTFIARDWIKHYFMFPSVGRMDDIWAAYYVQALGANVLFNQPTVTHARNDHDITKDMMLEYIGYENTLKLIEALDKNPEAINDFLPKETVKAFDLYRERF